MGIRTKWSKDDGNKMYMRKRLNTRHAYQTFSEKKVGDIHIGPVATEL